MNFQYPLKVEYRLDNEKNNHNSYYFDVKLNSNYIVSKTLNFKRYSNTIKEGINEFEKLFVCHLIQMKHDVLINQF